MEIQDQLGRKILLSSRPERIVSLVPSQTELLVDLGLSRQLVGITKFCVHPKELRSLKKIVGGTKQVHYDRIANLKPDIILCNKEENTKEMVLELEKIAPVHVSDVSDLEDSYQLIEAYGNIFNKAPLAQTMIKSIKKKADSLREMAQTRSVLKVVYLIWNRPLMAAGKNTFIDKMLGLNNLKNVVMEDRYPEVSLDVINKSDPDLVLLSSEPFPFREKHKEDFSQIDAKLELVDGEMFSWYGSRLVKAMDYFKEFQERLLSIS